MKHEGFIGNKLTGVQEQLYTIFRVFLGFFFFMHGSAKVLGWFSGKAAMAAGSLFWFVGLAEMTAALLILFGLWTRIGALIGAVIMISAWFKAHAPNGWNPMANGGELALMFLIGFIVVFVHGSGKYGLERWITKKECV